MLFIEKHQVFLLGLCPRLSLFTISIDEGWREIGKGKGRRVCLGSRLCSILCPVSCFASIGLEKTDEFILFVQIDRGKTAKAWQGIEQNLPPKQTRRPFLLLSPSFFYDHKGLYFLNILNMLKYIYMKV